MGKKKNKNKNKAAMESIKRSLERKEQGDDVDSSYIRFGRMLGESPQDIARKIASGQGVSADAAELDQAELHEIVKRVEEETRGMGLGSEDYDDFERALASSDSDNATAAGVEEEDRHRRHVSEYDEKQRQDIAYFDEVMKRVHANRQAMVQRRRQERLADSTKPKPKPASADDSPPTAAAGDSATGCLSAASDGGSERCVSYPSPLPHQLGSGFATLERLRLSGGEEGAGGRGIRASLQQQQRRRRRHPELGGGRPLSTGLAVQSSAKGGDVATSVETKEEEEHANEHKAGDLSRYLRSRAADADVEAPLPSVPLDLAEGMQFRAFVSGVCRMGAFVELAVTDSYIIDAYLPQQHALGADQSGEDDAQMFLERLVAGPNFRSRGPDLRNILSAGLYTWVEVVSVDPDGKGIIVRQLRSAGTREDENQEQEQ